MRSISNRASPRPTWALIEPPSASPTRSMRTAIRPMRAATSSLNRSGTPFVEIVGSGGSVGLIAARHRSPPTMLPRFCDRPRHDRVHRSRSHSTNSSPLIRRDGSAAPACSIISMKSGDISPRQIGQSCSTPSSHRPPYSATISMPLRMIQPHHITGARHQRWKHDDGDKGFGASSGTRTFKPLEH